MKTDPTYLFDTVALSNFALAQRLNLLVSAYGKRLLITPEVLNEVSDGVVAGYPALRDIEDAVDRKQFKLLKPSSAGDERSVYRQLLRTLAPGEASCIARATALGSIVVTDDRTARDCCVTRGVPVTGTIGILKTFCLNDTLSPDDADDILESMIKEGYYAPVRRVSDLM